MSLFVNEFNTQVNVRVTDPNNTAYTMYSLEKPTGGLYQVMHIARSYAMNAAGQYQMGARMYARLYATDLAWMPADQFVDCITEYLSSRAPGFSISATGLQVKDIVSRLLVASTEKRAGLSIALTAKVTDDVAGKQLVNARTTNLENFRDFIASVEANNASHLSRAITFELILGLAA